jgi:HEAT repeat protein
MLKRKRHRARTYRAGEQLALTVREAAIDLLGRLDDPRHVYGLLEAVEQADKALDGMYSTAPRTDVFAIPGGA